MAYIEKRGNELNKLQNIKYLAPPVEILDLDINQNDITVLGKTTYHSYLQDKRRAFGINSEDRNRHIYAIGKSGVGKSKFLESLIRQDIVKKEAVIVIDPHGDLIEDVLDFIPGDLANEACLIDPSDEKYPVAFNPLANVAEGFKYKVTQDLVEVMAKQFKDSWTSKLEHVYRFSILALLDYKGASLADLIPLLTDKDFRQEIIGHIKDDWVKKFWATEFSAWSQKFDSEAITPLVNKIGQFLSDPVLRNIFTQRENKIDFYSLMKERKIVLINLSKGYLGEENSSFFGSIFLTKIKQAGMERAQIPKSERNKVYLFVDEFHNLVSQTMESLLAESRKYGLSLTLAHQYLGQLQESTREAIFGNVNTIISFRISSLDAEILNKEFVPHLSPKDFINLPQMEFYIKSIVNGEAIQPFSARSLYVQNENNSHLTKEIRELSRKNYSSKLSAEARIKREEKEKAQDKDAKIEPII